MRIALDRRAAPNRSWKMTHDEKVAHFRREIRERGRSEGSALPLAFRHLWRLGLHIPPPYFIPYRAALGCGIAFGALWGLGMACFFYLSRGVVPSSLILRSLLAGVLFGICMATCWLWCRRRLGLGSWRDYPTVQPRAGADARSAPLSS